MAVKAAFKAAVNYTPQFKKLTFQSKALFEVWREKNAYRKIKLMDKGQDLTEFFIHKSGEIIDCDQQGFVWNGMFVDMKELEGGNPQVIMNGKATDFLIYAIEEIPRTPAEKKSAKLREKQNKKHEVKFRCMMRHEIMQLPNGSNKKGAKEMAGKK